MKLEPFRIEPTFLPRIWGARSLAPLYPEAANLAEAIGEVWLTGVDCKIASGSFAGKTLGQAWREMPPDWRGTRFTGPGEFPLLIKFIFPHDKLSIQVHPDDAYAAAHETAAGGRGKTEMWHAISADPGAEVLIGLKPGVDKEKFLAGLASHTLDRLFEAHTVHVNDTFFLPSGTPHTIGPGMLLCEVQEYSDLTYRVYDYGRVDARGKPRELHIEKALEVMNFGRFHGGRAAPLNLPAERASKTLLAACRYFAAERWEFRAPVETQSVSEHFEIFVILNGSGYIHGAGSPLLYRRGHCWLVPASLGRFSWQPEQCTLAIRAYVPDLVDLASELHNSGFSAAQLGGVIFA